MNRLSSARARVPALLVAAALATAGCSGATAGTASPDDPPIVDSPGLGGLPSDDGPTAPPASAEASDELLGTIDAGALAGDAGDVYAVSEGPGGTLVVLAGDWLDRPRPSVVAEYAPGDAGPRLVRSVEIPAVEPSSRLHVAADGTVLVVTEAEGGGAELVRLAPGAVQPQVLPVDTRAVDDHGSPAPVEGSALTADGGTVLLTVNHWATAVPQPRLVTVDAATGAVTGSRELAVDTDGYAVVTEVAARPDGGVAVLLVAALDGDGDVGDPVLAQYDADLRPDGRPVRLSGESDAFVTDLRLLPDGAAVVAVDGLSPGATYQALVVVRGGDIEVTAPLDTLHGDRGPESVAVAPDGATASVPYTDSEGRTALATFDLGTGELIISVPLCDGEGRSLHATRVGGQVAAVVECPATSGPRSSVAVVG